MISAWLVYLIAVVDNVRVIIGIIAAMLFVCAIVTIVRNAIRNDMEKDDSKKIPPTRGAQGIAVASMILALLASMMPNQKGLAAIVLVPAVLNDARIQNITGNSLEALEALTRKWMLEVIKDDSKQKKM